MDFGLVIVLLFLLAFLPSVIFLLPKIKEEEGASPSPGSATSRVYKT